jgi:hypothetical protein
MTKETNNNSSQSKNKKYKAQNFQVSYSLNNYQPVLCTHVSDQPFFYMDDEQNYEDDALLDAGYIDDFEEEFSEEMLSELRDMQKKMQNYENFAQNKKEHLTLEKFITDSKSIEAGFNKTEKDSTLEDIENMIGLSRMSQHLYEFAIAQGVEIILSNQIEISLYDKKSQIILIRQDMDIADQTLLLVQELRRHWQDINGAMVDPMSLHPEQAILINRAQKADLAVAIVRCAWEMKLQGRGDIWSRIENSSLYDLGRALAREALSDFRTLNNGIASSALFETWFLSERSNHEDKIIIQKMLADYRGYMFTSDEPCFNQAMEVIANLGEQPFGKNYLSVYAGMIVHDSLFTDVRDRSNANFLWFIKFERKYKEAEEELCTTNSLSDIAGKPDFSIHSSDSTNAFTAQEITSSNNIIHVQF